jgi:hypothetical protein
MLQVKVIRVCFLMLALALLYGCAAKGPSFTRVSDIPSAKGLVYVYRSPGLVGSAVTYHVHAGDEIIGNLRNGGYFYYFADPGELEIWAKTEAKGSVTLDILAGQEQYVKGSLGVGFLVGRPKLIVVDSETGRKEIEKCKLLTSQ